LIDLPEASLYGLREALQREDLPIESPDNLDLSNDDWLKVRAVLRVLQNIREDEGLASLLADIREAPDLRRDVDLAALKVETLLKVSPETEQRNMIRRAQYAALPVLENLSIEVDFRAVKGIDGGGPTLVPVFVFRLHFDEPVGGSEAIAFQVPEKITDVVLRRLQRAKDLRASVMQELPSELIHEFVRAEVAKDG